MSQSIGFEPIRPSRALYIKLGEGGIWEHDCIQQSILRLGYGTVDHDACLQSQWQSVKQFLINNGSDQGAATRHANQVQEFYEAERGVLWVTFHADRLWWCFSEKEITLLDDYTKIRPTAGWRSEDIYGNPLDMSHLKGSLLAMQGYQGTICNVRESTYIIDKINGNLPKDIVDAEITRDTLRKQVEGIVKHLDWHDFEVLTDLIFQRAGWQRVRELGGKQKGIDLVLFSPITRETYAVQVKSKADRATFEVYRAQFQDMRDYSRFYFIVHSPAANLTKELENKGDNVKLILPVDIALWVVEYGLTDWVISKAG